MQALTVSPLRRYRVTTRSQWSWHACFSCFSWRAPICGLLFCFWHRLWQHTSVYIFFVMFAHANSTINVFLYGLTNSHFREGYVRFSASRSLMSQSQSVASRPRSRREAIGKFNQGQSHIFTQIHGHAGSTDQFNYRITDRFACWWNQLAHNSIDNNCANDFCLFASSLTHLKYYIRKVAMMWLIWLYICMFVTACADVTKCETVNTNYKYLIFCVAPLVYCAYRLYIVINVVMHLIIL